MSAKEIIVLGPQGEPLPVPQSMCILGPQNEFIAFQKTKPDPPRDENQEEK